MVVYGLYNCRAHFLCATDKHTLLLLDLFRHITCLSQTSQAFRNYTNAAKDLNVLSSLMKWSQDTGLLLNPWAKSDV